MKQGVETDATCNINQCWGLVANNTACFRLHGAKSFNGSNFAQQLPTTRNNMQQGVQTDATPNDVASVSTGLLKGDALMNSPLNVPVHKETLTNEVQRPPSHDFDSHLLT